MGGKHPEPKLLKKKWVDVHCCSLYELEHFSSNSSKTNWSELCCPHLFYSSTLVLCFNNCLFDFFKGILKQYLTDSLIQNAFFVQFKISRRTFKEDLSIWELTLHKIDLFWMCILFYCTGRCFSLIFHLFTLKTVTNASALNQNTH